ncbi:hypothetical protein MMPV_006348 [Pyropia vietnamensis]
MADALRPTLEAAVKALQPTMDTAAGALRPLVAAVYATANVACLPGWVVLGAAVVAGATARPRGIAAHVVLFLVAGFAVTYVVCMVFAVTVDALPPTDLSTLDELQTAFARSDWLLTAGWVHYLGLDLLTGLGVVVDAGRRRAGRGGVFWTLGLLVCLAFVMLVAPAGLLLYVVFRTVVGRAEEAPAAAAAGNVKED